MITGIGMDLVEVARMQELLERWGERFLKKLFTENEINSCQGKVNQSECLAARFAAKEALAKALGHGWCRHFSWTDVEIYNEANGKPAFKIGGKTKKLVEDVSIFLSLTHIKSQAAAFVIIERVIK